MDAMLASGETSGGAPVDAKQSQRLGWIVFIIVGIRSWWAQGSLFGTSPSSGSRSQPRPGDQLKLTHYRQN